MTSFAVVPRRVTVTSAVHLFQEPRLAWRVQTEAPFVVTKEPAWRIIGVSHARNMIEYGSGPGASTTEVEMMYAAAEEAMANEADWPVMRWIPLDGDLSEGAIDPANLAFSLEEAARRTAINEEKAGPKKPRARRVTSLGRGLKDLTAKTGDEAAPADSTEKLL